MASPPSAAPAARGRIDRAVLVIGAGMAGLACARRLAAEGAHVLVVDKARGAGGRASTRRGDGTSFDHGAQYFTARDAGFAAATAGWVATGVVARWDARIIRLEAGRLASTEPAPERFVGVPRMSALWRHLCADLPVRFGARVAGLRRDQARWRVALDDGGELAERFDDVVVATPSLQAVALLAPVAPALGVLAARASVDPCWAVPVAFATPVQAPFDGAFVEGSPLAWIARDSSKPGRPTGPDCWVLHASVAWSAQHVDEPADVVAKALLAAFDDVVGGALPAVREIAAHRWLYARTRQALGEPCLHDPALRIGACGDWCLGANVEAAWRSGVALAQRMLAGRS